MTSIRKLLLAGVAVTSLGVAACSHKDQNETSNTATTDTTTTTTPDN